MKFLFSICSITMLSAWPLSAAPRPNIIIIMVDDMGYSDLGCYGSEIDTPNLDRLATEGIRYSQMYNTSKCTTSRSALLTGRYVSRNSWEGNYNVGPTFGEIAQAAGYRTLWSGKNHSNIRPPERGFDRFFGFQGGATNYWGPGPETVDGLPVPNIKLLEWMVDDQWIKPYIPEDPNFYLTDAITDHAIDWLEEYQGEDKPFLLYMAYTAPHWPLHAPEQDIDKYRGRYDAGYQVIRQERYDRMVQKGLIDPETAPLNPQEIKDWNSLSKKARKLEAERLEIHAAMVDHLDQNIGRLIAELKDASELDNTLILFFSDNGASAERYAKKNLQNSESSNGKLGSVSSYECIGQEWARVVNTPLALFKKTSHEGGVCSPMIAHWPQGIAEGNTWFNEPAHLVDVMSTVLELTGQTYPESFNGQVVKPTEGVSLVPSFSLEPLAARKYLIGYDFSKGQGIRDGIWKLVRLGNKPWELYDMSKDRTETNDHAAEMPEKVDAMVREFSLWEKQCEKGISGKKQ
ncbi:arylsulfatase [Coraliomargarita parva]|uniref:arylsulfatase n=1 Tax=Coraliomargarita parva TaxID=3014050 RepID=UPI0022B3C744|nr:arylsulfatase [Coraliomargarita parva]